MSTIEELLKSWGYSIANHWNEPNRKSPRTCGGLGEDFLKTFIKNPRNAGLTSPQELRELLQEVEQRSLRLCFGANQRFPFLRHPFVVAQDQAQFVQSHPSNSNQPLLQSTV
jgi:hypothetical protein